MNSHDDGRPASAGRPPLSWEEVRFFEGAVAKVVVTRAFIKFRPVFSYRVERAGKSRSCNIPVRISDDAPPRVVDFDLHADDTACLIEQALDWITSQYEEYHDALLKIGERSG